MLLSKSAVGRSLFLLLRLTTSPAPNTYTRSGRVSGKADYEMKMVRTSVSSHSFSDVSSSRATTSTAQRVSGAWKACSDTARWEPAMLEAMLASRTPFAAIGGPGRAYTGRNSPRSRNQQLQTPQGGFVFRGGDGRLFRRGAKLQSPAPPSPLPMSADDRPTPMFHCARPGPATTSPN